MHSIARIARRLTRIIQFLTVLLTLGVHVFALAPEFIDLFQGGMQARARLFHLAASVLQLRTQLFQNGSRFDHVVFVTLDEDFAIGEGIQRSIDSGAVQTMHYGSNEWALKAFNDFVDRICEASPT